jgi:hypothetical protein
MFNICPDVLPARFPDVLPARFTDPMQNCPMQNWRNNMKLIALIVVSFAALAPMHSTGSDQTSVQVASVDLPCAEAQVYVGDGSGGLSVNAQACDNEIL